MKQSEAQTIPLRVYQTESRIMLAAPMPGLEGQDISVEIAGDRVTIHGEERGRGQHERDLTLAEWTIGPYHREMTLDEKVNASLTNATYGNGVLVLSMPKLRTGEKAEARNFVLNSMAQARGERVGHKGNAIDPVSVQK